MDEPESNLTQTKFQEKPCLRNVTCPVVCPVSEEGSVRRAHSHTKGSERRRPAGTKHLWATSTSADGESPRLFPLQPGTGGSWAPWVGDELVCVLLLVHVARPPACRTYGEAILALEEVGRHQPSGHKGFRDEGFHGEGFPGEGCRGEEFDGGGAVAGCSMVRGSTGRVPWRGVLW